MSAGVTVTIRVRVTYRGSGSEECVWASNIARLVFHLGSGLDLRSGLGLMLGLELGLGLVSEFGMLPCRCLPRAPQDHKAHTPTHFGLGSALELRLQ